jgi:NTE family protein
MTNSHQNALPQVGVVLPGGGARGAYQAGSLLYLAEYLASTRSPVAAVAAASVGAINGAILAAGPTFLAGAQQLAKLWISVGQLPPSELRLFRELPSIELGALLSLLFAAGESTSLDLLLQEIGNAARRAIPPGHGGEIAAVVARVLDFRPEVIANPTLQDMLRASTNVAALRKGVPLYVSVYPSAGAVVDSARFVLANLTSIDTSASRLLHVQSLPDHEMHDAILGSAAIPFIFDAKMAGGAAWSDGSIGGWRKQTGQVPATALCERVSISRLYVLHCSDGSLWDRRGALLPPTIEVRPSQSLGSGRPIDDLLSADAQTIERRLQQGYEDARRQIGNVAVVIDGMAEARNSKRQLRDALDDLNDS